MVGYSEEVLHANEWKTHEDIRTIRPSRDGVIADFDAAQQNDKKGLSKW
jgi:actin-like ATPase involved in cell morphogenesis